jgi:hypothetical protein
LPQGSALRPYEEDVFNNLQRVRRIDGADSFAIDFTVTKIDGTKISGI